MTFTRDTRPIVQLFLPTRNRVIHLTISRDLIVQSASLVSASADDSAGRRGARRQKLGGGGHGRGCARDGLEDERSGGERWRKVGVGAYVQIQHYENTNVLLNQYHSIVDGDVVRGERRGRGARGLPRRRWVRFAAGNIRARVPVAVGAEQGIGYIS